MRGWGKGAEIAAAGRRRHAVGRAGEESAPANLRNLDRCAAAAVSRCGSLAVRRDHEGAPSAAMQDRAVGTNQVRITRLGTPVDIEPRAWLEAADGECEGWALDHFEVNPREA